MNFFRSHAISICCALITVVLWFILNIFCSAYPDFTFFLTIILVCIPIISFAKWLFNREEGETCLSIVICSISLIIASHKLYSFGKLKYIIKSFEFSNEYVVLGEIVTLVFIILLIIKLCKWSNIINRQSNFESSQMREDNTSINSKPDIYNSDFKNPIGYIIACILGTLILLSLVGGFFYFIYKNDNLRSWVDLFKAICILICCVIGIPFGIYIVIWFVKQIINLLSYKEKGFSLPKIIKRYQVSFFLSFIILLIGIIFFKKKFTAGDLINFASNGLENFLAFPLMVFILLAVFFILTSILHGIFVLFNFDEDKIPRDNMKKLAKKIAGDLLKIVDLIYRIVYNTIKGLLNFLEIIPDYTTTILKLVHNNEDENTSDSEVTIYLDQIESDSDSITN